MLDVAIVAVVVAVVTLLVLRTQLDRVIVYEHQRAIRYRNGRIDGLLEPGRHWIYRPSVKVMTIDIRQSELHLPGQGLITSDGISLKLSVVVRYKVIDPITAVSVVESYPSAVYSAAQIALREVAGALSIDELLASRNQLGAQVAERVEAVVKPLGVEIIGADLRDLMFPGPLKRTFAQVVEARQQGLAALERARGETAALRSLANAARMLEAQPALFQIRLLQKLDTPGNTVVLGMPTNSIPVPIRTEPGPPPRLPGGTDAPSD